MTAPNFSASTLPVPSHFIAIDEALHNSRLQWGIWGGLWLGMAGLILLLNLPLSYQAVLIFLTGLCCVLSQLLAYHITAISTLPLALTNHNDSLGEVEWQLGITQVSLPTLFTPTQQAAQLWQADLVTAKFYHILVVLEFWVKEPTQKKLTVVIYQDQVTTTTWRQLAVLARQP